MQKTAATYLTPIALASLARLCQTCCFSIVASTRSLNLEAESAEVARQWCSALQDHMKYGMLASIDLGEDLEAEQKQARKAVERERAYSAHKADRDKLKQARESSAQRASVFRRQASS